jgi:hypothetical protein
VNGRVRLVGGSWFFQPDAFAGFARAWPFAYGPSGSDAPPAEDLRGGDAAYLTTRGTVLVDRPSGWHYAGRVAVDSPGVVVP